MEFPFDHTHHHGKGGGGEYPPPPPPSFDPFRPPSPYYGGANEPPPPQVTHVSHSSHGAGGHSYPPRPFSDYYDEPPPPPRVNHVPHISHGGGESYPPPPFSDYYAQPPPPPPPPTVSYPSQSVQHVSHESETDTHHHHLSNIFHHHTQHHGSELSGKPSVRVFSKAETNYSLAIRHDKVILAPSDPSDPFQQWIKDEKWSTRVKDAPGFPSFALVNKATGLAMKHSIGATQPVQLIPYNPDVLDESVLWTLSKDVGDGFRTIRMVNNIRLNVDAFHGDKRDGGVHDGTTIVIWEWNKGDNQLWKIVPY